MYKKLFSLICVTMSLFLLGAKNSYANVHTVELQAVLCSKDLYEYGDDYYYAFEACRQDYIDGKLNEYVLNDHNTVNPGDLVLFVEKYIYGGSNDVNAYSTRINYDSRYWRNNIAEGEEDFLNYFNVKDYPVNGRGAPYWRNISVLNYKPGAILIHGEGDSKNYPLTKDMNLAMFGLILKDNVPVGTKLTIGFEDYYRPDGYNQFLKKVDNGFEHIECATKGITFWSAGSNEYLNKIVTNKYTIKRDGEVPILVIDKPGVLFKDFFNDFENITGTLRFYDRDGNELYEHYNYIGSFMKVKLFEDGEVKDEVTIVVKGDLDGNGVVNVVDYFYEVNIVLGHISKDYLNIQIGDVTSDGRITSTDCTKVISYALERINSFD